MTRIYLFLLALVCNGFAFTQNTEERYYSPPVPINSLENPSSYAAFDHYKVAKAKGSLVYGRDYIFDGISATEVSQQLIDEVDPYRYLHQFLDYEKVFIELEEQGLTLILFPKKISGSNSLNENE